MEKKKIAINKTKDKIVSKALLLFIENGIEKVKMTDIAKESKVGVASVYRYFGTKKAIAIEAGIKIWQKAADFGDEVLKGDDYENMSGFMQVLQFCDKFCEAFDKSPNFFKFLRAFDVFMEKEKTEKEELSCYEERTLAFREILFCAYNKGIIDGSIRVLDNFDLYYFTVSKSALALSEKLICQNDILLSDEKFLPKEQIRQFLNMAVNYIKK